MPLQLVSPPAAEPVTVDEAKLFLRVDFSDDDALIDAYLVTARQYAEMATGRQLITATWKYVLDAFPGPSLMGVPFGHPFTLPGHAILIPKSPVQSVTSIQYLDMSATWQTMPATDYVVENAGDLCRITPVFGKIWQPTLPQVGAVQVTFVAGYGDPSDVPEGIKTWIKLRTSTMYANREEVAVLPRGKVELLPFVDGLLDPYKVVLA